MTDGTNKWWMQPQRLKWAIASVMMSKASWAFTVIKTSQLPFLNQSYSGKPFPVLVDWMDCGRVVVGSLVLSMIASVWPAWEVMRINVVETLSDRA